MNTQIIFSIVTLVILIITIIWKSVDWRDLAIKWVGNNPDNAAIYIKAGDTVKVLTGKRMYNSAEADIYIYKPGKEYEFVFVPRTPIPYPYHYISGKRIIGLEDGNLVPSPLGFMGDEIRSKYKEGVTDISAVINGQTMVKAIHSIKSNKVTNILLFVIIALVVAAGIWWYINKNKEAPVPVTANQTQQLISPASENQSYKIVPEFGKTIP